MERILVGIDGQHSAWEALARAFALAKRIGAHLHVLLVRPTGEKGRADLDAQNETSLRKHLELRIEAAKAQGVQVEYYITEGGYEDEVVRFVNHNRITLLVYELRDGEHKSNERGSGALKAIRHRISCKVEVVAPRKNIH
jgi:nucleotide-binding universal stress UspA family protein